MCLSLSSLIIPHTGGDKALIVALKLISAVLELSNNTTSNLEWRFMSQKKL